MEVACVNGFFQELYHLLNNLSGILVPVPTREWQKLGAEQRAAGQARQDTCIFLQDMADLLGPDAILPLTTPLKRTIVKTFWEQLGVPFGDLLASQQPDDRARLWSRLSEPAFLDKVAGVAQSHGAPDVMQLVVRLRSCYDELSEENQRTLAQYLRHLFLLAQRVHA